MAGINSVVEKVISGEGQFTDALKIANNRFNISIIGVDMNATVTLQRRLTDASFNTDWRDVADFTESSEVIAESIGAWEWRLGVKTGKFVAATSLTVSLVY